MKKIILFFSILFSYSVFAQEGDKYAKYLQSIQKELDRMGMQINVNNPNPFITGTALQGFYLNEKILLLERDAYFMMKSNKLETTEEVADYQHRLKVLTSHANNILLGLVRALKTAPQEGFHLEAGKNQLQWEELIERCKRDPSCIGTKMANGEVIVQSDLIDSFSFSLQLFKQIPYMHSLEFASVFQLVQLLYMETITGYSKLSKVEFDLFIKKQKKLIKELETNRQMTKSEKEFHRTVISNTVNKWKKKILERKFDQRARFQEMADKVRAENKELIGEISALRKQHRAIRPDSEICRKFLPFQRDRQKCILREKLEDMITQIKSGKTKFVTKEEKKLPKEFWDTI